RYAVYCVFFSSSLVFLDLHSFPTRRSSDLIDRVAKDTTFGGRNVLNGDSANTFAFQVGADAGQTISIKLSSFSFGVDGLAKQTRSEEHTSELQSRFDLVCRLLLEKKKKVKQ